MPAFRWLGLSWHLSSDALALVGLVLLLVDVPALVAAVASLATFGRPAGSCHKPGVHAGEEPKAHLAVVWGLPAMLALNVVFAGAMVLVGCRGMPLTPSTRRCMGPIMYAQLVKWMVGLGFAAFSLETVYTTPASCWVMGRRLGVEVLLWTLIGVFSVVALVFALSYNALASHDPVERWETRLRWVSRLLGCHQQLTQPPSSAQDSGTDPAPPLKELSRFLARSFGAMDVEKTDVLAGVHLASVMMRQQRRAAALARLAAAGVPLSQAAQAEAASAVARQQQQQPTTGSRADSTQAGGGAPNGSSPAGSNPAGDTTINVDGNKADRDEAFWEWLHGVCSPPEILLEPPRAAAELAPQLSPEQLAAACCAPAEPAPQALLEEAAHWARHAVAAYGSQAVVELSPNPWAERVRLLWAVCPRQRVLQGAQLPVQEQLRKSRTYMKHYWSAKQVAGYTDADAVYLSFADSALGEVPFGIVLDRKRRSVVLTIRGTSSMASLLSDLRDKPEELGSWLPAGFRESHPGVVHARGHSGILSAAKGVLADLERHQIIRSLLTWDCQAAAGGGDKRSRGGDGDRSPEEYCGLLRQRGLDCRAWSLLIVGHLLGGGIAALLAPHFADWWPDTRAWAFCPPGGLLSPCMAAALEPLVTCIAIGKDSVPRTSSTSFERLQDQVVVALARCKLSKLRVLLRGRSAAFHRLPPNALFFSPGSIPQEALAYLRSYFASKRDHREKLEDMEPPGRVVLLRRLRGKPPPDGSKHLWDAVWVQRRHLVGEGILLSRHQATDHYTRRLLAALTAVQRTAGSAGEGDN